MAHNIRNLFHPAAAAQSCKSLMPSKVLCIMSERKEPIQTALSDGSLYLQLLHEVDVIKFKISVWSEFHRGFIAELHQHQPETGLAPSCSYFNGTTTKTDALDNYLLI